MKKEYIIFLLLTISTNALSQVTTISTTDQFKKLNWLIGTWNRTNTKGEKSSHERWEQTSPYELNGVGVTLHGKDTIFIEKLRIFIKDNTIAYVADVPENQKPVYFKFTEISSTGFECENPSHDFPKKISYQLEGENLKAQVSGDGKAIDFLFERK